MLVAFVDDRRCFFCGERNPHGFSLRFREEDGWTVAETVVPWYLQGFAGVVHGGIVASLLDEVMSHSVKRAGISAVTGTLRVKYLKPCPTEKILVLRGRVRRRKGRIVAAFGEILYDGERVAKAEGIFVVPKDGGVKSRG
uniref:PaaI family thioesterase n=1 Tax=Candidatus Caldatribacterium californiense TaxID=1454726 RepID=A0A7V3YKY9_9BACT